MNLRGGGGLRFEISNNELLWIEIYIPRHLQMPFSEDELQKHLQYMAERQHDEVKDRAGREHFLNTNQVAFSDNKN